MADIVTAANTILEPLLVDVAVDNARLVDLIKVASEDVQLFINRTYTTASCPKVVEFATIAYVAYLWLQDDLGAKSDMTAETLGDYSYNRGRGAGTTNKRMDRIVGMLKRYVLRNVPGSSNEDVIGDTYDGD